MVLRKFDMAESNILKDRYNIRALPMVLMYYGGKLAYASSTLNGYGTSMDDLVAQANSTLNDVSRGVFVPDDFKFGG